MPFTTAIFYDIENLLKGYNFSQQMVSNLSLVTILKSIRETGRLSDIAVHRAYANWSDPRLAILRGEINELGIDPIQVFGFSREQKKNAADIQLAIDAIDIAHVRPGLEVFVIVSGDGGFASLAKKLHEYGKSVIGCAYRNSTNKTFQSVCDDFVWIGDPEEEERSERSNGNHHQANNHQPGGTALPNPTSVTDPRNVRMTSKLKRCKSSSNAEVFAKVQEVLNWYINDHTSRTDLAQQGVYLNVVQEAVRFVIPDFQSIRFGFAKFSEYLQYACKGLAVCVVRPPHSQAMLMLRSSVRPDHEILPDLDLQDLQSLDGYRSILATGMPIFRLPVSQDVQALCHWLTQRRPEQMDLGAIIEAADAELNGSVGADALKLGILAFLSAGVFNREPEGTQLSEQRLTLMADLQSAVDLHCRLRIAVTQKIQSLLGEVNDELINQLISPL